MANHTGKGCFKKGESGNPGGRPKLPAEVKEAFQSKAPEALAVLVRCLDSSDNRIAIAAATAILDRGYGRPTQAIDANVTQDGAPIRYYAELPRKDVSPEAWSERVGPAGTGTPPKSAESAEAWLKDIPMLGADSADDEQKQN